MDPGVNGNEGDNSAAASGAAYVFTRDGSSWSQQAYIKASNTDAGDQIGTTSTLGGGRSLSVSANGNTLAVGAALEDSSATGVNADQADNSADTAGAVYVFSRSGSTWSQQAYVKASNTDADDRFGSAATLSGDGQTLAIGAPFEDSGATEVNGNQTDNSAEWAGAVYVYEVE